MNREVHAPFCERPAGEIPPAYSPLDAPTWRRGWGRARGCAALPRMAWRRHLPRRLCDRHRPASSMAQSMANASTYVATVDPDPQAWRHRFLDNLGSHKAKPSACHQGPAPTMVPAKYSPDLNPIETSPRLSSSAGSRGRNVEQGASRCPCSARSHDRACQRSAGAFRQRTGANCRRADCGRASRGPQTH